MCFECWYKVGRNWSYCGTVDGADSLDAARLMHRVHRRNVWRVRPEGSRDTFAVYRFKR